MTQRALESAARHLPRGSVVLPASMTWASIAWDLDTDTENNLDDIA
jgi:hypothetical protein